MVREDRDRLDHLLDQHARLPDAGEVQYYGRRGARRARVWRDGR
jgi:hypothetical protein